MKTARPDVKAFHRYLHANPGRRKQIAAPPDRSIVYAGRFFRDMWKDLTEGARTDPARNDYVMLPDVLKSLPPPEGTVHGVSTLLDHLAYLDTLEPWGECGFLAWRSVSGIYAANARGRVRFSIGYGVRRERASTKEPPKVFAATEIWVLLRNSNLDPVSRDFAEYLARCVRSGTTDIGVGLL